MNITRRHAFGLLIGGGAAVGLSAAGLPAWARDDRAAPGIVPAVPNPEWETRWFTAADGTRLAYRVMGQGRPLVMVHGGASNAMAHYTTALRLKDRFRMYMLERRNYGMSDDSRTPISYSVEGRDVHALLKIAGPGAALFGHSAGALVSLCAGLDHHDIARTMLYEPPLLTAGRRIDPILAEFRAKCAAGQFHEAIAYVFQNVAGNDAPGANMLADRIMALDEAGRKRMLFILETEMKNLRQLDPRPAHYRGIARPVTFFTGDQSAATPLRDSVAALHEVMPDSRVVTFKGQGHTANLFAPQMLADAIAESMA